MRPLRIIALGVALLIGGAVAWWQIKYPTYSYRYRLSLAIEADGKVHTGSSVIEIIWSGGPEIGDVGPYHPTIRGQATLVNLGNNSAIVAPLLNGESYGPAPDGALSALWIVPRAFGTNSALEQLPDLPRLTGRRQLSANNMPRLIWFADVADPKTARKVLATEIPGALVDPNGVAKPKARLIDAYVEITRDPIVVDIDKKLAWYNNMAARQKSTGVLGRPFEFQLSYPMFVGE